MNKGPIKIVCHNKNTIKLAQHHGWLPGAKYTNYRDVRDFEKVGLVDIDWENYDYDKHLKIVKKVRPLFTVARDIDNLDDINIILSQAEELSLYSKYIIIVPKDKRMEGRFDELIPKEYILGYSVPTKYGGTRISTGSFNRPVHLLGGRPDIQRQLANEMPVISFDCNRFTLDASFGDYFDGVTFRKHPLGGYHRCLEESIMNINKIWADYDYGNEVRHGSRLSERIFN